MRIHSMERPTRRRSRLSPPELPNGPTDALLRGVHDLAVHAKIASHDHVRNLCTGNVVHVDGITRALDVIASRAERLSMHVVRTTLILPLEDWWRVRLPALDACWTTASIRETTRQGHADPEQERFPDAMRSGDVAQMTATIKALEAHKAALEEAIDVAKMQRVFAIQKAKRAA